MALKLTLDIADVNGLQTILDGLQKKVKAGTNITIGTDGITINSSGTGGSTNPYTLPISSSSVLGGVKIGAGINVAADGTISVSSSGTSGTFTGLFKGSDTNFITVEPQNYNPSLKQGRFTMSNGYFPDVNVPFGSTRGNVVGNFWGYNTNPGGGQEISGEASYRFAGETHYLIGGSPAFEFHLPEIYTNLGKNVRLSSWYIHKSSGQGSHNMQIQQVNWKLTDDVNYDWATLRTADKNVKFVLNPLQGGQASLILGGRYPKGTGYYDTQLEIANTGDSVVFVSSSPFYFRNTVNITGSINTGAANWQFGAVVDGKPTIIINGVTYKLATI